MVVWWIIGILWFGMGFLCNLAQKDFRASGGQIVADIIVSGILSGFGVPLWILGRLNR